MKIISYNLNGIRAALTKGFAQWLKEENPDMICIQETKAQPDQIDTALFESLGYYCYTFSAEKKGYSGVAIFTKRKPNHVEIGTGIPESDAEGRVLRVDYDNFSQISVYVPSGSSGDDRQDFKMKWLAKFQPYITELTKKIPNLIISGDYNICHKPIDINHPEKHNDYSGFLPEEREWFEGFINSGLVDSFRVFNKEPNQYSWWSYRANSRAKNLGWRIDYNLITTPLKDKLLGARILQDVLHSDHCPVVVEMDL